MASIKIDDITREGSGVRVDWSAILDDAAYNAAQTTLAQAKAELNAEPTDPAKQEAYARANQAAEPDGGRHVKTIPVEFLLAIAGNPVLTAEQANAAIEAFVMPQLVAEVKQLQVLRAAYEQIGLPRIGQRIVIE